MSYVVVGKSSVGTVGTRERRLPKTTASAALAEISKFSARGFDVTVRSTATDRLISMQALKDAAEAEK